MRIMLDAFLDSDFSMKTLIYINWCQDINSCQSPYSDLVGTFTKL